MQLVAFGEAMVRFAPLPNVTPAHAGASPCVRSVGGDELNVCVDLAVLNKGALTSDTTPQVTVACYPPASSLLCSALNTSANCR